MDTYEFRLYSISQAAKMLGLGMDNIRKLIDFGRLATISINGRRKISHHEISRFIKASASIVNSDDSSVLDETDLFMRKKHNNDIKGNIITNDYFYNTLKEINNGKCI